MLTPAPTSLTWRRSQPAVRLIATLWLAALLFSAALHGAAEAPALLAPGIEASIVEQPDFLWQKSTVATAYEVQVARDRDFRDVIVADRVEIPRFVPLQALPIGECYWRVRALDSTGVAGPWSASRTYSLIAPRNEFAIPAGASLDQIQSTIAQAAATTPARVTFAPGATYRVRPEEAVFSLTKTRDLIIDGQDALIVIENPAAGLLRFDECARLTVRRLRIDYDPLPHSVGRVESVEVAGKNAAVVLRREPGYPDFDAAHIKENTIWGVILDPAPERRGWMKAGSPLVLGVKAPQVTRTAEGVFRVPLTAGSQAAALTTGDRVIVFARNRTRGFASVSRSVDTTFDRVVTYACPAGHFSHIGGSQLKVLRCGGQLRDASRWFAGNADGVHVRANVIGPWIEASRFEAIGDDAIALYNKGIFVTQQLAPTKLTVAREFMDLEAGESFCIFNPRDGAMIGDTFTVAQVTRVGSEATVEFTPALPAGVTLHVDAVQKTRSDQLFTLSRRNALFMVRNNDFVAVRRYGTVFRSPDGVVKNNRYTGTSNAAIATLNEPDAWHNGLASQRVLIAGNTIARSAFDGSSTNVGSIHVFLRRLGGAPASARAFGQIDIVGNTVTDWSQRAISLQNAERSQVTGNTIAATQSDFPFPARHEHYAIFIDRARQVIVRDNNLTGDHRTLTAPIQIGPDAETTVENNRLR